MAKIDRMELILADCLEVMWDYPANYFDLAVVDPPYGIGESGIKASTRGAKGKASAMSFPAGYKFAGTKTEIVRQIGNAVPVSIAQALCSEMIG